MKEYEDTEACYANTDITEDDSERVLDTFANMDKDKKLSILEDFADAYQERFIEQLINVEDL